MKLKTPTIISGSFIVTILLLWILYGAVAVAGIETLSYEVISKNKDYEIRQYEPYIVAQVTMKGSYRTSMNSGFRKLADYIFGNNSKFINGEKAGAESIEMTAPVLEQEIVSEKIDMTAPVVELKLKSGNRIVSFVMPRKYTMDTIPRPNNPDVKLIEVPLKCYAVVRFTGTVDAEKAQNKKKSLLGLVARDMLDTIGEPLLAQYNPPGTPPMMRRNEVLIELKMTTSE